MGFSVAGGAVGHDRVSARDAGGGVQVTAAAEPDWLGLADVDDDGDADVDADVEADVEAEAEGEGLAAESDEVEVRRISHAPPSTTTATPATAATMV